MSMNHVQFGQLASEFGSRRLPLKVLQSAAGFYIGTECVDDEVGCALPYSRESNEYWPTGELADAALCNGTWSQKLNP